MNFQSLEILDAEVMEKYREIIEQLHQRIIPEAYPTPEKGGRFEFEKQQLGIESLFFRGMIIEECGFVFVSYEWVKPLAQWIGNRSCLEIMAGTGALSHALCQCGVHCIATDDFSWGKPDDPWCQRPWSNVKKINAVDAIEKYGSENDFLICSWPPMDNAAYLALLKMREINTDMRMIYIGERANESTADRDFFNAVKVVEDSSFQEATKNFKSAYCIHDAVYLLK